MNADDSVQVLFFAALREATGTSALTVALPEVATADALLDALCHSYPALLSHRRSLRVAVNQEYVALGYRLAGGDEVALIPPVCGG